MTANAWHNERVVVTGADGFVGSHLVESLLKAGARVIAFTRGTSQNGTSQNILRNLSGVESELEQVVAGNVAQWETVRLLEDLKPDVIFHLAAEAYVPRSFEQPAEVFAVNATGTLHVLEAARKLPKLKRVVLTSSSEVYGTAIDDKPISEEHPLNPTSPYAASKVAADRLAYSYGVTYGMPIAIIRPFNSYGPRHTYDVIPKFIRLALAGDDLTVHGSGKQCRDFTYVSDTVRGFMLMGSHAKALRKVVNFGSGKSYSIRHTAERIVALTGSKSRILHDDNRLAEVQHLLCDASEAKRCFDWHAEVDLDLGLARNIEWEKKRMQP